MLKTIDASRCIDYGTFGRIRCDEEINRMFKIPLFDEEDEGVLLGGVDHGLYARAETEPAGFEVYFTRVPHHSEADLKDYAQDNYIFFVSEGPSGAHVKVGTSDCVSQPDWPAVIVINHYQSPQITADQSGCDTQPDVPSTC
ncbi:hypothetical protein Tco_0718160 [Tanacetum coccineum]